LASIIGGRPSPRQVQKATKRRTGQKRRAYQRRHRSHAQKIGSYFVLPIFEHGEEPPFGAIEHCGSELLEWPGRFIPHCSINRSDQGCNAPACNGLFHTVSKQKAPRNCSENLILTNPLNQNKPQASIQNYPECSPMRIYGETPC